jgi:hypothetical protein
MEKKILKILVKPSISQEALENWIWIYNLDNLPKGFIKIKNTINKKSIIVFKRNIDNNYISFYNSRENTINIDKSIKTPSILINEYYRDYLNLKKNNLHELEFSKANWFNKVFNSNWNHPNPNISTTHFLTIISLILGLVSLILGVIIPLINMYNGQLY